MAGKCTYTEAKTMEWDEFCELHECMDYEADYKYLIEKSRAK